MSNNSTRTLDPAVYVETEALTGWSSKMAELNTASEDILTEFVSSVEQLKEDWQGNSATGFETAMNNCLKSAKNRHNAMGQVEAFLLTVVETMQNQ